MEHIPKIFLSFQSKIFSVLGQWSWVFILIVAAAVILIILNSKTIKEVVAAEKTRFRIDNRREFEHTFSENALIKKMMADGESSFVSCAHCKHLENCKKCSKTDYDIAETVCGDFKL